MNIISSLLYFLGGLVFDTEITQTTKNAYTALGWVEPAE